MTATIEDVTDLCGLLEALHHPEIRRVMGQAAMVRATTCIPPTEGSGVAFALCLCLFAIPSNCAEYLAPCDVKHAWLWTAFDPPQQ